jgi:sugar phosphate isomerase/epimerase
LCARYSAIRISAAIFFPFTGYRLLDNAMKQRRSFPFRLGCTSWVFSADILPNVRNMAPVVDDIEIVLFESGEISNLPDEAAICELTEIGAKHHTTYTIHLPIDMDAGSPEASVRARYLEQVSRIIGLFKPVDPFGYILHLQGVGAAASERQRTQWYSAADDFCRQLVSLPGLDPARVYVENLGYPQQWHAPIIDSYRFSVCCDLGHLWLNTVDWYDVFENHLANTRVIHLHGVCGNRDHLSLKQGTLDDITRVLSALKANHFSGVVTLEVFTVDDTLESLELVGEVWRKLS